MNRITLKLARKFCIVSAYNDGRLIRCVEWIDRALKFQRLLKTMVLKRGILALVLVFISGFSSKNTGISYCIIKIIPVASGDGGTVLFKTYYSINPMGGSILTPVEIGWLVVSADRIWKESQHAYLNFSDGLEITSKDSLYLNEFNSPFNWKNPPESVLPLIQEFKIATPLQVNQGERRLMWTNNGVYQKKSRKGESTVIRSLKYISNQPEQGTPALACFYYKGIALFRSSQTLIDGDTPNVKGAVFLQGAEINNEELWIEEYSIDGLMFFEDNK